MHPDAVILAELAEVLALREDAGHLPFAVVVGIDDQDEDSLLGKLLHLLDVLFLAAAESVNEDDDGHPDIFVLIGLLIVGVRRDRLVGVPAGRNNFSRRMEFSFAGCGSWEKANPP